MDTVIHIGNIHDRYSDSGMIDDFKVNDQFIIIFQL